MKDNYKRQMRVIVKQFGQFDYTQDCREYRASRREGLVRLLWNQTDDRLATWMMRILRDGVPHREIIEIKNIPQIRKSEDYFLALYREIIEANHIPLLVAVVRTAGDLMTDELLEYLIEHPAPEVRRAIAGFCLDDDEAATLVNDPDRQVRFLAGYDHEHHTQADEFNRNPVVRGTWAFACSMFDLAEDFARRDWWSLHKPAYFLFVLSRSAINRALFGSSSEIQRREQAARMP